MLVEGLMWRIGNGAGVWVWGNPWLVDGKGKYATVEIIPGHEGKRLD